MSEHENQELNDGTLVPAGFEVVTYARPFRLREDGSIEYLEERRRITPESNPESTTEGSD